MADLDEIYNTRLLELAAHIPCSERLKAPDATATAHSKLCGSTITIDLKMSGDRVAAFGQTVKACLLGQATAAIVGGHIIGATAAEVRAAGVAMRAMLKEDGDPPAGRFADLALLAPARHYKARHGSVMLVFDALDQALGEIETRASVKHAAAGASHADH
jgi:NifU-like protein involved in Fe-S cluster formation